MGIFSGKIFKKREDEAIDPIEEKEEARDSSHKEEERDTQLTGEENFEPEKKVPQIATPETENIDTEEKSTDSSEPKYGSAAVIRGVNGRFVGKKSSKKQPQTTVEDKLDTPDNMKESDQEKSIELPIVKTESFIKKPLVAQTSIFYGQSIRKFNIDGIWWYSIVDILSFAKIVNIPDYISALKSKLKSSVEQDKVINEVEYSNDGSTEVLECVTYEGFMVLLLLIRQTEVIIPGPFPDWLKNLSEEPYIQAEESKKNDKLVN